MARVRRYGHRLLPAGVADIARQALLFAAAYGLYQLVRGLVDHGRGTALAVADATRVIDFERSLHVFAEPSIEHWALHHPWLVDAATWFYLNGNYAISGGVLLWIYLRRRDAFDPVRNAFLVAMAIALVGYAVFPTAPPRLMPGYGFVDVIQRVTGVDPEQGSAAVFVNDYAAIPSMHVCFALLTGGAVCRLSRLRAVRVGWAIYPVLVAFVVVATGNHYFTDVALGAVTAAVAAVTARRLARVGPSHYSSPVDGGADPPRTSPPDATPTRA